MRPTSKKRKKALPNGLMRVLFAALVLCAIVALSAGMTTLLQPPNLYVLAEPTDSAPTADPTPSPEPTATPTPGRSMRPLAHSMVMAAQTSSPKRRRPPPHKARRFRPLSLRLHRPQKPRAH